MVSRAMRDVWMMPSWRPGHDQARPTRMRVLGVAPGLLAIAGWSCAPTPREPISTASVPATTAPLTSARPPTPDPVSPRAPAPDAPIVDSPPPPARSLEVPAELASAPKWIGRTYLSSMAPVVGRDSERHVTYTLQRSGGRAALSVVTMVGTSWSDPPELLKQRSHVVYLGTVTEKSGVVSIEVENGNDKLALQCKRTKLRAARATAVRAYHAKNDGCGDDGRWIPGATKPQIALRCSDPEEWDQIAFAPTPGIEWVVLSDDCLAGGGWRAVNADGTIAKPRAMGKAYNGVGDQ